MPRLRVPSPNLTPPPPPHLPHTPPAMAPLTLFLSCFSSVCDSLRSQALDPGKSRGELVRIQEARAAHRKDIMRLRQLYVADTQRAKHDHTFQTIAFDGTNSNSCNCPQNWRAAVRGEAQDGTFVPQKIQSVLIHGKALLFYVAPPFVPTGMDLTVSCLVDALSHVDPRVRTIRFQFDGKGLLNACELRNVHVQTLA